MLNRRNCEKKSDRLIEETQYFILTIPAIILFAVFVLYPVLGGIYFSFTDWDGVNMNYNFIGLQNYKTFFNDFYVLKPLLNTFVFAFLSCLFQNILALIMAVSLNRHLKTKNLLRTLWFIPAVLSPLIVGYIWSFLFTEPIATLGEFLGIKVIANNVLGSPKTSLYASIFVNVWRMAGWYMVVYIAALQGIPREMYEAPMVDGATGWNRFRYVTFPMLAPSFTVNMVLALERGFKEFDLVFALTKGGPGNSSEIISLTIYRESFEYFRAAYGSTMGVILFAIIVVLVIFQLKILRKREENIAY
jgi:raffinose/stachyose/melibiose transport system permease protein